MRRHCVQYSVFVCLRSLFACFSDRLVINGFAVSVFDFVVPLQYQCSPCAFNNNVSIA